MTKEFTIRKGITKIDSNGKEIPDITPITISISEPQYAPSNKITKEDVWGLYNTETFEIISDGMIVSRSDAICSVFNDKVPYKSVTIVCDKALYTDVAYWIEYVQGANAISNTLELQDNKIAIRADYMCW